MSNKTKKCQVVLAAIDEASQSFQILLLQTNQRRGSFWQNVTGKLEDKESFEEGALREVMEETGLKLESIVEILNLNLRYDFVDQRERKVHEESFLFVLDKKWDVILDPHEHDHFKWVSMNEVERDSVKFESNYEPLKKSIALLKKWGGH